MLVAWKNISINELSSNKKSIINDNLGLFKRIGRVNNVINSNKEGNSVKIIVAGETITLLFDKNLDLTNQKLKITKKLSDLTKKVNEVEYKLNNKSFLKNAPKNIVEKEKKSLIDNKIELKKLNSIVNSIKN